MTIGEKIKEYRIKNNLTETTLSRKTGLHPRTIEYIEKGKLNNPRLSTLKVISKALDVNVKDLID